MSLLPENLIDFGILYNSVLQSPIDNGFTGLTALSAYSSGAFTAQFLEDNNAVTLRLIIGMAKTPGIPSSDHKIYCDLLSKHKNRFHCFYYLGEKPIHAKAYAWTSEGNKRLGFLGSPNFSWNGFDRYREMVVRSSCDQILEYADEVLDESAPAETIEITQQPIIADEPVNITYIQTAHGGYSNHIKEPRSVELSLLQRDGQIHKKSGLNWGQRGRPNPNEAYIPIRADVHNINPTFFPPRKHRFILRTDDGYCFVCVTAQDNRKAIETPEDNGLLGEYFRMRIGVPSGEFITKEAIERYGRTDIEITKVDEDLYWMDFSI